MAGDRRRQRQQRVRHDPGGNQNDTNPHSSNKSNYNEAVMKDGANNSSNSKKGGVTFAETKEYESVTIMQSKAEKEEVKEEPKFKRRQVLSNWSRYEEVVIEDDIQDGDDYMLGEDFSKVLQMNEGKVGGYLHLKGEMSWGESDKDLLPTHGLGALRLADLVAAISTIPLYEQIDIPTQRMTEELVKQFTIDAEMNKTSYVPNQEHVSDVDVNDKLLQSLKLSDPDTLDLTSDIPDSTGIRRSPVDATYTLSSAFQPEDGDVDLDSLVRESTPEVVAQHTARVLECQILSNENLPANANNSHDLGLEEPVVVKKRSPSLLNRKNILNTEQTVPINSDRKSKSPSPFITNIREKSNSPLIITSNVKEKSPSPLEVQRSIKQSKSSTTNKEENKLIEVPPLIKSSGKSQTQASTNLNFGLPKPVSSGDNPINPSIKFDIPKLDTSGPKGQRKSRHSNKMMTDNIDVDPIIPPPEVLSEELLDNSEPSVDLDAPIKKDSKPVLLISQNEAQNLEDWLDSVLDD